MSSDTSDLVKDAIASDQEALIKPVCRATAGDDVALNYLYRRSKAGLGIPDLGADEPTPTDTTGRSALRAEGGSRETVTVEHDEAEAKTPSYLNSVPAAGQPAMKSLAGSRVGEYFVRNKAGQGSTNPTWARDIRPQSSDCGQRNYGHSGPYKSSGYGLPGSEVFGHQLHSRLPFCCIFPTV